MLYYRTYTIKQNKNGSSLTKKNPKKKEIEEESHHPHDK